MMIEVSRFKLQFMDRRKEEINLLKQNQEKVDQKYSTLKQQKDEFKIQSTTIQRNNNNLEHTTKESYVKILKLKQEIQIVVHQKNEGLLTQRNKLRLLVIIQYMHFNMMFNVYKQLWISQQAWSHTFPSIDFENMTIY
jgi:hypothetical protein